jgi:dihydrofolate reductase
MLHHIAIVAAIGKNRELGMKDKLLWHIPEDMKRFRELTVGHPIIMGRKTFESILGYSGKPLPKRTNIVVTRDATYEKSLAERSIEEVLIAGSLEDAIEIAKKAPGSDEIHIGGGAQLYKEALPQVDRLYLTLIDDAKEADTFFPEYEQFFTHKTLDEEHESNGLRYRCVNLER